MTESAAAPRVDVLIAGAGPTGLVLAAQLEAFGASVAVVDTKAHPVAESRALAVQPRTLEVLRGSVTGRLLERGNPAVRLQWHAGGRTATLPLFDMGMHDTAYPFLLFLSQAETEQALVDHVAHRHGDVEWNTRRARRLPERGRRPDGCCRHACPMAHRLTDDRCEARDGTLCRRYFPATFRCSSICPLDRPRSTT